MRGRHPDINIIYEDASLIVCEKPAGLPVQTAKPGQADMVSELKNYRARRREDVYVGVVHRLDQPVRGIMVFAKTQKAAAALSKQISSRMVDKEYLAVAVQADPEVVLPEEGALTDVLLRDGKTNTSSVVKPGTMNAREARLTYQVLLTSESGDRKLVRVHLETGRHHQIRVQFAHAGWPLYGDRKYGPVPEHAGYCPLALCSCRLSFRHPDTGKQMDFSLDAQADMEKYII